MIQDPRSIANDVQQSSLNEQAIRQIVRDELNKDYIAGVPKVAPHTHDGNNNIKIESTNIVFPTVINGTVDMAQQKSYTFYLTGKGPIPRDITFYGGALISGGAEHAMIVGNAKYGTNQQFQPDTSVSVITGPVVENIIQGSASFVSVSGGGQTIFNSQGHILYAEYPAGTPVVIGTITDISNSSFTVNITTLASNWSVHGLWIVS